MSYSFPKIYQSPMVDNEGTFADTAVVMCDECDR